MWNEFFSAGGWGMYPVSILGFFLIAASVLYALRPGSRWGRLAFVLGLTTFASGMLGAIVGICMSAHYLSALPPARQLPIFALGVEESLHDVVLALMLVIVAGLISIAGAVRAPVRTAGVAAVAGVAA